jgi:hypothetical protein
MACMILLCSIQEVLNVTPSWRLSCNDENTGFCLANQIECKEPDSQRQFGCFHDRACCHGRLVSALPALIALESSAVHKAMERRFAAQATKAVGPADLGQRLLTLGFRSVELQELGHGEPLLELNGVAAYDQRRIRVPL